MRRACYTAIANGYDELRDHPDIEDVDWVAYVTLPQQYESSNWDVRPLFGYGETDPRRQAKWYKVQSGLEMAEYDRTVWIDGSVEIGKPQVLADILDVEASFGLYRHTDRDCVYEEAGFSMGMRKYADEPIREQMNYYLDEYDHPQGGGLWWTGIIVRNRSAEVERIERAWWREIERWSVQDQLSLPVVLRYLGEKAHTLPQRGYSSFKLHQQPFAS